MKRSFLLGLGIGKSNVNCIMREYGRDVTKLQEKIYQLETVRQTLEQQVKCLQKEQEQLKVLQQYPIKDYSLVLQLLNGTKGVEEMGLFTLEKKIQMLQCEYPYLFYSLSCSE